MFLDQRLELLLRSGDIRTLPDLPDVYWSIPPALRKKTSMQRCQSSLKMAEREQLITGILTLRSKLETLSQEMDCLLMKKDQFPTQGQITEHMDRLDEYDDYKDIGQALLGHLAEIKKCRVQAMYEEYALDEND
jgi:hypothetical protein